VNKKEIKEGQLVKYKPTSSTFFFLDRGLGIVTSVCPRSPEFQVEVLWFDHGHIQSEHVDHLEIQQ